MQRTTLGPIKDWMTVFQATFPQTWIMMLVDQMLQTMMKLLRGLKSMDQLVEGKIYFQINFYDTGQTLELRKIEMDSPLTSQRIWVEKTIQQRKQQSFCRTIRFVRLSLRKKREDYRIVSSNPTQRQFTFSNPYLTRDLQQFSFHILSTQRTLGSLKGSGHITEMTQNTFFWLLELTTQLIFTMLQLTLLKMQAFR